MVFIYESFRFIIQITMPTIKRFTNYCNYAIWNCYTGEGYAVFKGLIPNRCNTIWDIYAGERVAERKSPVPNNLHSFSD